MSIKIIDEEPIYLTRGALARYREEYERAMSFYAGPPITLEEFIRRRRKSEAALRARMKQP